MELRQATFKDWDILLRWRNDPLTRRNSLNSDIIEEEPHKKWLKKSLTEEGVDIYILNDAGKDVGMIRSDFVKLNTYVLSWNIAPEFRGFGYGNKILKTFLDNNTGNFIAEIKTENIPSIKMVNKLGFEKTDDIKYTKNMTDLDIIDEIEKVRGKNNVNWMDILRLAFKHAPDEAREIMSRINSDDGEISKLLKQLSEND